MKITFQSWLVPNFARVDGQNFSYRLKDIDAEDLDDLCNRFRAEVFRKAGKGDPAYPAQPEQGEGSAETEPKGAES